MTGYRRAYDYRHLLALAASGHSVGVILRILYCYLGRYERHTSVRPAAMVGGACGTLCPYWSVLV